MEIIQRFVTDAKKMQWLIFSVACFIYLNTVPNKWAIDDSLVIHENSFVKRGASGLKDIFTSDAFVGFYGEDINAVPGGRYRPLTPAIFALEAELFASKKKNLNQEIVVDPEGYAIRDIGEDTLFPNILHLINVILYGILCLIIYKTIHFMFHLRQDWSEDKTNFIAASAALLFAAHPLHTEVVANVKSLDEILALMGSVIALYYSLKISQSKDSISPVQRAKWLLGIAGSFFLALLSKESAATFIAVIPMAIWFFTDAPLRTIFNVTIPLFIPLFIFLGIRSAVLDSTEKGQVPKELLNNPFLVLDANVQFAPLFEGSDIQKIVNPSSDSYIEMPTTNRLATTVYTFGYYVKLLFIPYPLTIDYYPRHIEIKSFSNVAVLLSLVFHLFLLSWAISKVRAKHIVAFGIFFYFITFSIVSNLFFNIGTNMAERFMFTPSLGFCLIIAYFIYNLGQRLSTQKANNPYTTASTILIPILLIFAFITFSRNFKWKDNLTLFSNDAQVSLNSGKIQSDLAGFYIVKTVKDEEQVLQNIGTLTIEERNSALLAQKQEQYELLIEATKHVKRALKIHPMSSLAWLHLGNAQLRLGSMDLEDSNEKLNYLTTAYAALEQAEIYKSVHADKNFITNNIAVCLRELGKVHGERFGNIEKAIEYLEKAKLVNPNDAETYLLLGTAYSLVPDHQKAVDYTKRCLELRPNDRDSRQNLAVAYQQFALADSTKKYLLPEAERILLEIYQEEQRLGDNDAAKVPAIQRTLDLLYKNYTLQKNSSRQEEIKSEILKYNPGAFPAP